MSYSFTTTLFLRYLFSGNEYTTERCIDNIIVIYTVCAVILLFVHFVTINFDLCGFDFLTIIGYFISHLTLLFYKTTFSFLAQNTSILRDFEFSHFVFYRHFFIFRYRRHMSCYSFQNSNAEGFQLKFYQYRCLLYSRPYRQLLQIFAPTLILDSARHGTNLIFESPSR